MAWGHVEWYDGGLVRVFEDHQQFGDPYQYVMPFKKVDDETVELVGVTRPPTISQARAILLALQREGLRIRKFRFRGAMTGYRTVSHIKDPEGDA